MHRYPAYLLNEPECTDLGLGRHQGVDAGGLVEGRTASLGSSRGCSRTIHHKAVLTTHTGGHQVLLACAQLIHPLNASRVLEVSPPVSP